MSTAEIIAIVLASCIGVSAGVLPIVYYRRLLRESRLRDRIYGVQYSAETLRQLEELTMSLRDEIQRLGSFIKTFSQFEPNQYRQLEKELSAIRNTLMYSAPELEGSGKYKQRLVPGASWASSSVATDRTNIYRQISGEFSHTLKTPLASISLAVSSLSSYLNSLSAKGLLDMNDHDMKIVLDMMDQATGAIDSAQHILVSGAGFLSEAPEELALPDVVRRAERMVSSIEQEKRPRFENEVSNVPTFWWYPCNLLIALVELLRNAVQASPQGDNILIKGDMDTRITEIRIQVINTGIIAPEYQVRLFSPPFSTKPGGQGLGLATARNVMEEVGGEVRFVGSEDGKTTFEIAFRPTKADESVS